jgi:apolipoprotein D and lipocalin family protein
MRYLALAIILAALAASGRAQHEKAALTVVPDLDVKRYMGTWYEIARLPNRFQDQCTGEVTATYSLRDDGDIMVVNRCRNAKGEIEEAEGRARRSADNEPPTKLKVRFAPAILSFLPFVWGDYWILDLAPDYSHALVGEPSRKYLWVLSRNPGMDETTLRRILDIAERQGYDVSTLIRTAQNGHAAQ